MRTLWQYMAVTASPSNIFNFLFLVSHRLEVQLTSECWHYEALRVQFLDQWER